MRNTDTEIMNRSGLLTPRQSGSSTKRVPAGAGWIVILVLWLLFSGGCALHRPQPGEVARAKEAHLEKLMAERQYQAAREYLPELAGDLDAVAYTAAESRVVSLIDELETETAGQAAGLLNRDEPAAALNLVEQALKKIPDSTPLREEAKKIRQELDRRRQAAEWVLLLSRTNYLASQLRGYRELAHLKTPSWLTRWRLEAMADAWTALRPELLECGRQALAAAENQVAIQCLQLARDIEESEPVDQLLTQARTIVAVPEPKPEPVAEPTLVPGNKIKKIINAPAGPTALELETRLQEEISRQDLPQAYTTLAQLQKLPEAADLSRNYLDQLNRTRAQLVDKYLEEGTNLYRSGMIAQARESWLRILILEPDNQTARDKVERAERVLKKLRDLQNSQQKMTPPQ